jgi:hypothetical protein
LSTTIRLRPNRMLAVLAVPALAGLALAAGGVAGLLLLSAMVVAIAQQTLP